MTLSEVPTNVFPFPRGGRDMIGEFPVRLSVINALQMIEDLQGHPELINLLERAIRLKQRDYCYIGLTLDLEITRTVSSF